MLLTGSSLRKARAKSIWRRTPLRVGFGAWTAVLFLLLFFRTDSAQAQDRNRFARWMYQDATELVRMANPQTPLYALGGLGVLASISFLDSSIDREIQANYRGVFADYVDVANELGGFRTIVPVTSLFAVSLATRNRRFQDAAFTSFQSMIYANALNFSIKYATGRFRPLKDEGPHRFAPLSGNASFPSGHTATAFAILTPWAMYYPHVASYSLLALGAGGTALGRIAKDKHWATDVLAGGTIGFLTAYWLTRRHQGKTPRRLSLTPITGNDAFTLHMVVRL